MPPTRWTSAQVQAELTALIEQQAPGYQPNDPLPTYEELHQRYGLSVATIARMIARMRAAKLVYGVPGLRTFVAERE